MANNNDSGKGKGKGKLKGKRGQYSANVTQAAPGSLAKLYDNTPTGSTYTLTTKVDVKEWEGLVPCIQKEEAISSTQSSQLELESPTLMLVLGQAMALHIYTAASLSKTTC